MEETLDVVETSETELPEEVWDTAAKAYGSMLIVSVGMLAASAALYFGVKKGLAKFRAHQAAKHPDTES